MAIEKGRKPNTWLITFNLPEKDASGKYKRAPKRTIHGLKSDAKKGTCPLPGRIRKRAGSWVEKIQSQAIRASSTPNIS